MEREFESGRGVISELLFAYVLATNKQDKKYMEEQKMSLIINKMTTNSCKLFRILLAKNFDEKQPKLNTFMQDVTRNSDPNCALQLLQEQTCDWV